MIHLHRDITYNPIWLFPLLLVAHSSIAYGHFNLFVDLWFGLFGILLPVLIGIHLVTKEKKLSRSGLPFWRAESLPAIPASAWVLLVLFLGALRFYRLGQAPPWPLMDEGQFAFYAAELCRTGRTSLLLGNVQIEPLFTWILALFFKVFGSSLDSIRLFPVLLSLCTMGCGYWAARKYFSRSFSFILLVLYGSTFWSQVCARQCLQSDLVPLFQFLLLGLLGSYSADASRNPRFWGVLFGSLLGAGLYLYTVWPAMVIPVLFLLWYGSKKTPRDKRGALTWALMTLALLSAPMLWSRFSNGGMDYVSSLFDPRWILWHLAALFFTGAGSAPYGPAWGGLLNSVLGSCFWIGVIELVRRRDQPFVRWIAFTAALFSLPDLLTRQVEMHRAVLLFPLLLIVTVAGVQALVQRSSKGPVGRWVLAALILSSSAALDIHHYWGPFQDHQLNPSNPNHWMSIELARAYRSLQKHRDQGEKFVLLGHLNNNWKDGTFDIAASSLGMARDPNDAPWRVLLTNVNYRPYLEKRFPGSRVESLCEDLPGDDDGLMLFWTPYNRTTRDVLDEWGGFDLRYQGISEEAFFFQDKGRTERAVEGLLNGNEGWRKDPFLRAQWAERVALYASMPPRHDLRPALTILQEAVRTCPSAHLYDTLGIFWMSFGNTQQAERSFQAACRSPLNHTSAASNLELLSRIKAQ